MLQFLIVIFVVIADQSTKYLSRIYLKPLSAGTFPIVKDIFHFTYVENYGAAFGILQNKKWFFIGITILILIAIFYYSLTHSDDSMGLKFGLSLILGGAIGNLIDRIRFGYVVDFLDFRMINYPVFNIADSAVVLGTILLAFYLLFSHNGKRG